MKVKYIFAVVIVAVVAVWGASAFFKTTIQYVSIEQAKSAGRTVQVMGKIDFDMVNFNEEESRLEFAVFDAEAVDETAAERLKVHYYGVVPGNFDQATSVVLKGKPEGDTFVAEQMLVKCPSKYQGDEGEYQDMEKHNSAIENEGV